MYSMYGYCDEGELLLRYHWHLLQWLQHELKVDTIYDLKVVEARKGKRSRIEGIGRLVRLGWTAEWEEKGGSLVISTERDRDRDRIRTGRKNYIVLKWVCTLLTSKWWTAIIDNPSVRWLDDWKGRKVPRDSIFEIHFEILLLHSAALVRAPWKMESKEFFTSDFTQCPKRNYINSKKPKGVLYTKKRNSNPFPLPLRSFSTNPHHHHHSHFQLDVDYNLQQL